MLRSKPTLRGSCAPRNPSARRLSGRPRPKSSAENSRFVQQRLPKFKREPGALPTRRLTSTSLEIVDLLARYEFLPTSLLVRLCTASKNITHRHLQLLFHRGLVN